MKKIMKPVLYGIGFLCAAGYAAATGFLYMNQTKLMYFPSPETPDAKHWKTIYSDKDKGVVLGYEFETTPSTGVKSSNSPNNPNNTQALLQRVSSTGPMEFISKKIQQHKLKNKITENFSTLPEEKTVLLFHGNVGSATHRDYYQKIFPANTRVIVAEYPGFGANFKETISKEAFLSRARELTTKVKRDYPQVVVAGESLGTGIAAQMALENQVQKMMLFTPYSSISEVASYRYPWIPVGYLLKDNYDTLASVAKYSGQSLIVLSEEDTTIPIQFGKKVFDMIPSAKTEIVVKKASHSTWWKLMSDEQKKNFSNFLQS